MAKVYPCTLLSSSSSMSTDSRRAVFTIWMKSLVFNGNGCTVYDSNGQIIFRIDNYDCKCSDEVYLMDHSGKDLFKILRKKHRLFGRWEGYRCSGSKLEEKKPWFRVQKACKFLRREPSGETTVTVGCGRDDSICYKIDGLAQKSAYRITDMAGGLLAEVKQKQTATGIGLGNDVLTLVLEPNVDHLLIMGLVVVCGLMNYKL